MKKFTLLAVAALLSSSMYAQEKKFYATMTLTHAEELKKDAPSGDVEIIDSKGNEAVVYMTEEASDRLHQRILTHGPGYFYKDSKEEAIKDLRTPITSLRTAPAEYTITEDALVNAAVDKIDVKRIEEQIQFLEAYGTRFHTTDQAQKAVKDLVAKWEGYIKEYNRDDISVEIFEHNQSVSPMPSIIMTIKGSEMPDEYVIIGGHLDSTVNRGSKNTAPGADDDASGISTITEAFRALLEIKFKPKRTIQIMAYSAEEVGLKGSADIAKKYKQDRIDVYAVGQFDMTNYKGSAKDIYFIMDNISNETTKFMQDLLDHYNKSGKNKIVYGESKCGYACSDHASWTKNGYRSAFPFESDFSDLNSQIHTTGDKFTNSGSNASHARNFCILATEFMIEAAKGKSLSVDEYSQEGYSIKVFKNALRYNVEASKPAINSILVYNVEGKKVSNFTVSKKSGKVSLKGLSSGVYIANIKLSNNKSFNKKFILK